MSKIYEQNLHNTSFKILKIYSWFYDYLNINLESLKIDFANKSTKNKLESHNLYLDVYLFLKSKKSKQNIFKFNVESFKDN